MRWSSDAGGSSRHWANGFCALERPVRSGGGRARRFPARGGAARRRIGGRCGFDAGMLLDIGEGLSVIGPIMGGVLRRQVLTQEFDSGRALGHLLKNLETASSLAQARDVEVAVARRVPQCMGRGGGSSRLRR